MLFQTNSLEYQYPNAESFLFRQLNLGVKNGNIVCVMGKNGSGKSTFLSLLASMKRLQKGFIYYNHVEVNFMKKKDRAKIISFLPSQNTFYDNIKIIDIVLMGRYPYKKWFSEYQKIDYDIAYSSLEKVNMLSSANKTIFSISKGELQRVMLARLLATQAPVMIMDEPLSSLDISQIDNFMELIQEIKRESIIFLSLHELNIIQEYADYVLCLGLKNTPTGYLFGETKKVFNSQLIEDVFSIKMEKVKCYYNNLLSKL